MPKINTFHHEPSEELRHEVADVIEELERLKSQVQFFPAYSKEDGTEVGGCIIFADHKHYALTLLAAVELGFQLAAKAKEELEGKTSEERKPSDWN